MPCTKSSERSIAINQPSGRLTGGERKTRLIVLAHEQHHLRQRCLQFFMQIKRRIDNHHPTFDQTQTFDWVAGYRLGSLCA